jgi:hypothetical protein
MLIITKQGSWAHKFNTVPVTGYIEALDIVLVRYDNICASQLNITLCEVRDLLTVATET